MDDRPAYVTKHSDKVTLVSKIIMLVHKAQHKGNLMNHAILQAYSDLLNIYGRALFDFIQRL